MATYQVLSPLLFDGERYSPDDPERNTVDMPPKQADELLELGVLQKAPAKGKAAKEAE